MDSGSVFKRCGCRDQVTGGLLGAGCPRLCNLWVPKTSDNWADVLRDAVGSVTRTVSGGQVLVQAGV